MKCFFKTGLWAIASLIVMGTYFTQYYIHQSALETSAWLAQAKPTVTEVSANMLRLKSATSSGKGIAKPVFARPTPAYIEVTDDGTIFLKGHDRYQGQLIALIPTFANGKVQWHCLGGPRRVTTSCKNWHFERG